jgi:hypothetical protein
MIKLILCLILLVISACKEPLEESFPTNTVAKNNIHQTGTSSDEYINDTAQDTQGNIYVTGYIGDPNYANILVIKYDSSGNILWNHNSAAVAWEGGKGTSSQGEALAIDSEGNIYILGKIKTSNGWQIIVVKWDNNGNEIKRKRVFLVDFDPDRIDIPIDIALDDQDNIYIIAHANIGFHNKSVINWDSMIVKYHFDGDEIKWKKNIKNSISDKLSAIAFSSQEQSLYVAGYINGDVKNAANNGFEDVFLAKYDVTGDQKWVKKFGTDLMTDKVSAIAFDQLEDIYIVGTTWGAFNGYTNQGGADVFMAAFERSNGNRMWLEQFGTSGDDYGNGIVVDEDENIYAMGQTENFDVFVAKYRSDRLPIYIKQIGTEGTDNPTDIIISHDKLYIAGNTDGYFPGFINNGGNDIFLIGLEK